MNEKIKLDLFLVDLHNIYDLSASINYLEHEDDDDRYNIQLGKVFKYEPSIEKDEPFDANLFTKKCDELYDCINTYDKHFMTELLKRLLSNNYKDMNELSNSIRFYFISLNLGIVQSDPTQNFNPMLFLENDEFRKLMFGFLFSYDCFFHTHRLFLQVFKNTMDLSDPLINNTVTHLCHHYCAMFS